MERKGEEGKILSKDEIPGYFWKWKGGGWRKMTRVLGL
jgi:hypothetical protein